MMIVVCAKRWGSAEATTSVKDLDAAELRQAVLDAGRGQRLYVEAGGAWRVIGATLTHTRQPEHAPEADERTAALLTKAARAAQGELHEGWWVSVRV